MRRWWLLVVATASSCNMIRGPAKDGECRGNLRSILGGEVGLFSERARYTTHPAEIGFAPAPGNRYLYLFDAQGPVSRRDEQPSPPPAESVGIGPDTRSRGVTAEWLRARFPAELLPGLGVHGQCPQCSVTVGCAGNLDEDETVDVWTISSVDRTFGGVAAIRGTAFRHVNDRER